MAHSQSLKKGQTVLLCQMCEESPEIKFKCLTCEFFMCTKCCKIHRKVKSSDLHKIVDLKDMALHALELAKTPDFTNINCRQHKDQKCCLYCKVCDQVVCPTCVAQIHKSHEMAEIKEGYQISLSKIRDMNSAVERDILNFTSDISKLDSMRSTERSRYLSEKDKILYQEKAVKDAIEKNTKKLLTDLDQRWNVLESAIKDEERYAVKVTEDLEVKSKAFVQTLDSNNVSDVFKLASEGSKFKRQPPKPINTNYKRLPRFVPGEINPLCIEPILGILEEIKEVNLVRKVNIQVREQYTTTFPYVPSLLCCEDGSVWISDTKNEKVHNVKLSHGSIYVNKTFNLWSTDMALTPSGDLLLSKLYTNLHIIPHTTGEVEESKFSVSPLVTTCVHVSKDNKIIVGTRESGPGSPVSVPKQVVVMDMSSGRHEQVYHHDNKNKPLFTYPYKLTTDKDNNIFVIDWLSRNCNGRVVVLEQGGDVRGVYTGHPDVNDTDHSFKPEDIVTTQSDNVIVSDRNNHTLHILNKNVQCVQYLNTKHSGIIVPLSLYIDNKGLLFIGCDAGKGKSDAKIHVVEFVDS